MQGTISLSKGTKGSLAGETANDNGKLDIRNEGGGGVTVSVPIIAISQANIEATGGSGITIGAALGSTSSTTDPRANTNTITLRATKGNITETTATAVVSASNLIIQASDVSGTATIGSTAKPFVVATGTGAASLAALATGIVNISNTGKGTLTVGSNGTDKSQAGTSFGLSSAGSIISNSSISTVSSGLTTLTLKSSTGSITIGDDLSTTDFANGTATISAAGSITDSSVSGTDSIKASKVVLSAATIGGTTPQSALRYTGDSHICTDARANLQSLGTGLMTLLSVKSTGSFSLSAAGPILVTGPMTTESAISLSAAADHDITLKNSFGSSKTDVSLTTSGTGAIILTPTVPTTVILSGKNISLSSVDPIGLKLSVASSISVNSGGSVAISNVGNSAITLNNSNAAAGSSFVFVSGGKVTTAGSISGDTIDLTAASILVAAGSTVGGAGSSSVSLTSKAAGTISTSGTGSIVATKGATPTITLSSTSGAFGSVQSPVDINTERVKFKTTGLVNINNAGTKSIALDPIGATPTSSLTLVSVGSITTSADITSPSSITLATTGIVGDITLGGKLSSTSTGTINLSIIGSGAINDGGFSIKAANVNLNTGSASELHTGKQGEVLAATISPSLGLPISKLGEQQKAGYLAASGLNLLNSSQFEQAESQLRAALAIEPSFISAHCNLGLLLNKTGRASEAIEHLSYARLQAPDAPAPLAPME